jgi:enoyl-CoA hydratase
MSTEVVVSTHRDGVAYIELNRPSKFNAIIDETPRALRRAVEQANADDSVRVIVLSGRGRAFCSGYDLDVYAARKGFNPGFQAMPWDPIKDFQHMYGNTNDFMSLFRSLKPVVCKLHGAAVGGGSDIALCCDLVVAADNARIGYPPARLWGCPTTFMWVYRLGIERAKAMLLTGDIISGVEAARIGLVYKSVPADKLNETVDNLVARMVTVPTNQLIMQKMVVNQALENMGLSSTQRLATVMDGVARHTPEGVAFKQECERVGWKEAVRKRDNPAVSGHSGKNIAIKSRL